MREELSEREKQVAANLAAGLRPAGVARELSIAEVTVRNHLSRIFSKLGVHSQSELIDLVRERPALLGPYRGIAGASEGSLIEELENLDLAVGRRLNAILESGTGAEAMREAVRSVLPLDEARRREWRTRLAVHAVAPEQRNVRAAFEEARRKWVTRPLHDIEALQQRGLICSDLEPAEVRRQLFATVYAAALALLADPSLEEQRRQLDGLDKLLESFQTESA